MRKLRKIKRGKKMIHKDSRAAAMPSRNTLQPPPPQATPVLSHLLTRLEDANGRMGEKCNCLQQMNDRLLGSNPEQTGEKLDTTGAVVQQLERQIMVYEMLVTRFGSELERLSCI